ncbi:hypothetical protein EDD11_003717 [Mortierella claussenii]|nr:hypothetical protein EDD11_003717 [Mortierella claussenii]
MNIGSRDDEASQVNDVNAINSVLSLAIEPDKELLEGRAIIEDNGLEFVSSSGHEVQVELRSSEHQTVLPSLPPTSSLTTALESSVSLIADSECDLHSQHPDKQLRSPQPLATKPAYKRRVAVPVTRADGIIRRSGASVAVERQMLDRPNLDRRARSATSIYDKPSPLPRPAQLQKKRAQQEVPSAEAVIKARKLPPLIKPVKPPLIWRPAARENRGNLISPSQHWKRSRSHGLVKPVDRTGPVEALIKHQDVHKQRISQLAIRPLPVRDLRTLIQAELEQEAKSLMNIAVALHKEILKLQLEEGVLLNMLGFTESGLVNVSDLHLLRPQRKGTISKTRGNGHIERVLNDRSASLASETGDPWRRAAHMGTVAADRDVDGIEDVQDDQDLLEDDDDVDNGDDDDDDDDEKEEEDETEVAQIGYDGPLLHPPEESYSVRPFATEAQIHQDSSIGRPGAVMAAHRFDSLNDDLYELDYDGDEGENADYLDKDHDEDLYNSEEDESETAYDDEDGVDGEEEDDQAAREALQRMLSQYGAQ